MSQINLEILYPVSKPSLTELERNHLIEAFDSTWISSTGKYIIEFENRFSEFCDTKYGVSTSNGTVALHLALEALGIGKGDEVIVPDITFAATINAVLYTGATPVIADVEMDSWCISIDSVTQLITSKTKAIIPVHIYGQVCEMDGLTQLAKQHNLYIIEDCAEAHGAEYKGRKVGSIGHVGCYSFFANKIITTGEGGMCITNDSELASKMKILRDHGMQPERKYFHNEIGYNYRMTNLQAAIGMAQLSRIDEILAERDNIRCWYEKELKMESAIELQKSLKDKKRVNWLMSMLLKNVSRDDVIEKLRKKGVDTRPFFIPLSLMPIYKPYSSLQHNAVSYTLYERGINLPTYISLTNEDIQQITTTLKETLKELMEEK